MPLEHLCMLQNLYVVVWYFEGIKPISNFFLFFTRRFRVTKNVQKHTKTQASDFPPLRSFARKNNHRLSCFLFACFCFVNLFLLDSLFCLLEIFALKKATKERSLKLAWYPQNNILLTCTPIDLPIESYCLSILVQFFLPHGHFHLKLCVFVWILKHQKYWYFFVENNVTWMIF